MAEGWGSMPPCCSSQQTPRMLRRRKPLRSEPSGNSSSFACARSLSPFCALCLSLHSLPPSPSFSLSLALSLTLSLAHSVAYANTQPP
eukprot:3357468-Rhodomonas_salina.1